MPHILVAGGGLCGSLLVSRLLSCNCRITWIDDGNPYAATRTAYGLLNPVWIRGITPAWRASEFYPLALQVYRELEAQSGVEFLFQQPVFHVLPGHDEAVRWRQEYESSTLVDYVNGETLPFPVDGIIDAQAVGTLITGAFRVRTIAMLDAVRRLAADRVEMITGAWEYSEIEPAKDRIYFRDRVFDKVVFAEGWKVQQNPWFGALPMRPCKGDVLTLEMDVPDLPYIIHRNVFLLPEGNGVYRCGSNYYWDFRDECPEEQGATDIENQLKEWLYAGYRITGHTSGVRPAVADRRPLVGCHPSYNTVWILNGMGSKGLMMAPYYSALLADALLSGKPVEPAVDVQRFRKRLGDIKK